MFPWNKPKPPSTQSPASFFSWSKEHDIGIRQFDAEHQHMGSLISQLHTLMVVKRDRTAADQLTDQLIQTTRTHFANEEALLTEHGYPEWEAHFHEHSILINELHDLQRQFKAGTLSALAMPTFLKKWLLEHIQNTDRKYVSFLKSKGIA
jgi:hemerythrin-like metal-binding protein